jgi:hypothetical protein
MQNGRQFPTPRTSFIPFIFCPDPAPTGKKQFAPLSKGVVSQ